MSEQTPAQNRQKLLNEKKWVDLGQEELDDETLFMDSGAYGLFNINVIGKKDLMGKHGRPLRPKKLARGSGKYDFYDLSRGSAFRTYCDKYAAFIKAVEGSKVLIVNVDVLHNPELTWQVQRYFEEEHGVSPVPVIHAGSDLSYLDRYLERSYRLLGVGGFGHAMSMRDYVHWADQLFTRTCPASNKRLPIIRAHGFAMTSWKLMCRWPWWSVDSATWIKLAAYGWILVPKWVDGQFCFDEAPLQINVSRKVTERKNKFWWTAEGRHPRQIRNKHYDNSVGSIRAQLDRWLSHLGVPFHSTERPLGVTTCFRARTVVNLHYLKSLEESRPKWPWPLDESIAQGVMTKRSFGVKVG